MSSEVEIGNMALGGIGVSHEISSLAEASSEAEQVNRFYAATRNELLRDLSPQFARRYVALALVASEPNDDWAYSYRYPSDCLRALRIVDGNRVQTARIPWEIASDTSGKLIYTDQDDAKLRYIARIEDPEQFDPSFVEVLYWKLAWKLATPLSRSKSERDHAFEMYRVARSIANANDGNEGERDNDPDAESIRARD